MGVLHGLYCTGCCWALMALMFFAGTMNLLWIAGLAILLGIDRIPDMMRSAINVLSQISVAALVDRWTSGGSEDVSPPA